MNKKPVLTILAVIAVLFLAIWLVFWRQKSNDELSNDMAEPGAIEKTEEVFLDEEGFEEENEDVVLGEESQYSAIVYFFWGEGCPYCEVQKKFLEELKQKYPRLEVKAYET